MILHRRRLLLAGAAGFGAVAGLWRALSFICLGLVLIGIGLAYQRLLFSKPRPQPPGPDPAG